MIAAGAEGLFHFNVCIVCCTVMHKRHHTFCRTAGIGAQLEQGVSTIGAALQNYCVKPLQKVHNLLGGNRHPARLRHATSGEPYKKGKAPSLPPLADANSYVEAHVQGSASLKTPAPGSNSHVKMPVARVVKPGHQAPLVHRMVSPPRQGKATMAHQPPQQLVLQKEQTSAQRQPAAVVEQRNSAHNRAVRAEMASMASELQTKRAQLGKADAALR